MFAGPRLGRAARMPTRFICCSEALERRTLLASWTPLTHLAPAGVGTMELLTDGTILASAATDHTSKVWYRLTPDASGSYVNGSWSTLASMSLERLFTATNVLQDGRVFVLGGEYSGPDDAQTWTNTAEIYNPLTNSWSSTPNFPRTQFGDDPSMLLDDGRVICGYLSGPQTYFYNPATNSWSTGPTKLNNDRSDEETWIKLPDNSVLSYNIFGSPRSAQRFVPSSNSWVAAGTSPVALHSSIDELGPGFAIPDGRAVQIGATHNNGLYDPATNSWTALVVTPNNLGSQRRRGACCPTDTFSTRPAIPPTISLRRLSCLSWILSRTPSRRSR